jgi:DNA-binding transcriptional LysR family regulator
MDLAALQTFLSVAEQESFSGAAAALHLTQPAVSKRIHSLETSLGCRLFDRFGRTVRLTEAGQTLLPKARSILQTLEDGRRAIANLSGEVAGVLSLGTSHHIGLHHLPPVLRAFAGRYPRVEWDLHFMDSEAACLAVERGQLELAIVTLPPCPPPSLDLTPIWRDPLRFAAAAQHPLQGKGQVQTRDLATYPAILPAETTFTRQILERAVAPLGLQLKVGLSTNFLETIKMLVSVGLGWSVLPETLLDDQVRPLNGTLRLQRELGAVRHRGRTLSNAARALLGELTATQLE